MAPLSEFISTIVTEKFLMETVLQKDKSFEEKTHQNLC